MKALNILLAILVATPLVLEAQPSSRSKSAKKVSTRLKAKKSARKAIVYEEPAAQDPNAEGDSEDLDRQALAKLNIRYRSASEDETPTTNKYTYSMPPQYRANYKGSDTATATNDNKTNDGTKHQIAEIKAQLAARSQSPQITNPPKSTESKTDFSLPSAEDVEAHIETMRAYLDMKIKKTFGSSDQPTPQASTNPAPTYKSTASEDSGPANRNSDLVDSNGVDLSYGEEDDDSRDIPDDELPSQFYKYNRYRSTEAGDPSCEDCRRGDSYRSNRAKDLEQISRAAQQTGVAGYSHSSRVNKMISFALRHARSRSRGKCLKYVKDALVHAGLVRDNGTVAAQAYGRDLQNNGFTNLLNDTQWKNIIKSPYDAPRGAILVYQGGRWGHIEIRTDDGPGKGFVSDYKDDTARTGDPDNGLSNGLSGRKRRTLIGVYVKN